MAKKSQDEAKEVRAEKADMKADQNDNPVEPILSFPLVIPRGIEKALRKDHGLSVDEVYFLANVKDNTMEIYKK